MRVIGGAAKGRALKAPAGQRTRPTTDRVKEAIFNVLAPYVAESRVLDAFAGSGALGIEALSRGAASVVFMERQRQALRVIEENLAKTGLFGGHVLAGDCLRLLPTLQTTFDLVFLDPPYGQGLLQPVLTALVQRELLAEDALVVVETAVKDGEAWQLSELRVVKESRYGDTKVTYLRFTCEGNEDR